MSKRKPVHPIRLMQIAAQRCETEARERASLARSVKPLLDALELAIVWMPTDSNYKRVQGVRLAWRAKL